MLKHLKLTIGSIAMLCATTAPITNANELVSPQPNVVAQAANQKITVVDILWLNPDGGGLAAAQDYFQKLAPIVQKYGVTFNSSYRPVGVENGYLTAPDFIFTFTFNSLEAKRAFGPDPQFQDPEYAKIIPLRNRIFNFDDRISFRVEPFQ